MRKVYTTPAHFTMLLLKFFNLLLIFLSRPYVARNRCRFGGLAGGGFLVCGPFPAISWGASGPLDGVDHWRGALPRFRSVFGGCLEGFLAMAATYLRGFAGYYGDLFDRICRLADLATLFIYYIDK